MVQPPLPAELTDAIIDYLYADRIALAACSLVCHAWRDAAQHHLLAMIDCVGDEVEQLLTQIEAQDGSSRLEDDQSCNESLDHKLVDSKGVSRVADEKGISESFAAHVRELYVRGPDPGRSDLLYFNIGTMARLLTALPNMHTLHIKDLILKPSDTAQVVRDTQGAEGLKTRRRYRLRWLDLVTVYLTPDTRPLIEMLGLCVEVRDLTLDRFLCWNGRAVEEGEEEWTRCENIVINGRCPDAFEVRRMLRVDALKTFEVKFPLPVCVPMVLEMLGPAVDSLESLTLHLFSKDDIPPWKLLNAIPWTKLTHLSLVFKNPDPRNFAPAALVPIALLLSYLPQTIRAIELAFDVPSWGVPSQVLGWGDFGLSSFGMVWPVRAVGWDDLEAQLMLFTRLRSLIIRPYPDEPDREGGFLDMARKKMPKLAARGLL